MGFVSTIKGWLNIGGVKVQIDNLSQVVPKDGNRINAKVVLSTKSDKTVSKVLYKFLLKRTSGRGDDKETKEYVISQRVEPGPFELKASETRTLNMELDYALEKTLKDMAGVLGGVGKLAAFATGEKNEYYVVARPTSKAPLSAPASGSK